MEREHPSQDAVAEMRQEHARQLEVVVDAFKSALTAGGGGTRGRGAGRDDRVSREASPTSPHAQRSPSRHLPPHQPSPQRRNLSPRRSPAHAAAGPSTQVGSVHESSSSPVDTDYTADFEDINEQVVTLIASARGRKSKERRKHATLIASRSTQGTALSCLRDRLFAGRMLCSLECDAMQALDAEVTGP